jgi:hypothetical protein
MTDSRPVIAFLRFRAGVVSESKRTAHIVPHPGDDLSTLTALCGQVFEDPDEVELLNPFEGMPCNACVLLARIPDPDDELPAEGGSPPSLLLCGRTDGLIHTYIGTKSMSRPRCSVPIMEEL